MALKRVGSFLLIFFIHTLWAVRLPVFLPTTKFQSSYPYITGSTWRECCTHKLDGVDSFKPEQVKVGDTIFVMVNYFDDFFAQYHPRIQEPYILISHHFFGESDENMPGSLYEPYLDDPKLMAWFTHNPSCIHPKLHPLPLGIGDKFYPYGNPITFDECIKKYKGTEKTKLLYLNFSIHTAPQHRKPVYDFFLHKSFCTKSSNIPLARYLEEVAHHKFVISPRGNGLDCFRTWETLLMGSFPIVQTSVLDSLFEDLPVLIIKDWNEVTEELLEQKYQEFTEKLPTYNFEKLYMPYWLEEIESVASKMEV